MDFPQAHAEMMKRAAELNEGKVLARMADGCIDCSIYEPYVER